MVGHTNAVDCIIISQDDKFVVSGARDRTIRIWDTQAFRWEVNQSLAVCGLRGPEKIPAHIPDDGWIRTLDGGLLLWVPAEHRNVVCDMSQRCISREETDQPIRILWDKLCHGERWSDVWSGAR